MRILLVPSAYAPSLGGVEELTRNLAREYLRRNHEVEVWTHRYPAHLPPIELLDGVPVRRFRFTLPGAKPGSLLRFARQAPRTLVQAAIALKRFSPTVIHVQCFSSAASYAALLAALFRIPLVITLQGETLMDDHDIYEHSSTLRAALRWSLRKAATVTACSSFVLEDAVRRFGLRAGDGLVIPNGVEDLSPLPAEPLPLPFSQFILAVGRVVPKKGFDLLLSAYAQIWRTAPDVGLVIGGDGPALPELRHRIAGLGLRGKVALPGRLSRPQIAWAMRHALVFVMPSRVEPFGIVALEAMQAARPVILTNRGGASEIVTHDRDGLLIDPLDTSALARALSSLLADEVFRTRLATAGFQRSRLFSWRHVADRYLGLYEKVALAG